MAARKPAIMRSTRSPARGTLEARGIVGVAADLALAKTQTAVHSSQMPPEDRVHDVRVALKRLRAYWRLAKPHVAPAQWARERDRLRALAAALAAFRDADVARSVVEEHIGQTGDAALRSLLKRWVESKRALAGPLAAQERTVRSVVRRMVNIAGKLKKAGGGAVTWEWLEPGLTRGYRRGRRAWRDCRRGHSDAEFHTWRRRVKDLQYHMDLLRFIAPHRVGRLRHRVQGIAKALGDAHDLVELRDALERAFAAVRHQGWSAALSHRRRNLLVRIRHRMKTKYQAALQEAATVYAPTEREWADTLHKAWVKWERRHSAKANPTSKTLETDLTHTARGR